MAKLLILPVVDEANNIAVEDVVCLVSELVGEDFEDVVITDSGHVVYASSAMEQIDVNR